VTPGPTWDGALSVKARSKLCPRSREIAIRTLMAEPLKTAQAAYTWSWKRLPGMSLTATHCLSSTCPNCRLEAFGDCSSGRPPLPVIQCRPMSSL
jgi:hypothetical protein